MELLDDCQCSKFGWFTVAQLLALALSSNVGGKLETYVGAKIVCKSGSGTRFAPNLVTNLTLISQLPTHPLTVRLVSLVLVNCEVRPHAHDQVGQLYRKPHDHRVYLKLPNLSN